MGQGIIQISLAVIHSLLHLPENYEVKGMGYDLYRNVLNVYVYSDEVAEVEEGQPLPLLRPYYQRDDSGQIKLIRIDKD
jgi:hypothetical protein